MQKVVLCVHSKIRPSLEKRNFLLKLAILYKFHTFTVSAIFFSIVTFFWIPMLDQDYYNTNF